MRTALVTLFGGVFVAALVGEGVLRVLAQFLPNVAYLTHAGGRSEGPSSETLSEYLQNPEYQLYPLSEFYGYAKNSLGLLDKDFDIPKPKGRLRIVAVGDSFTHGTVPYPDNVMTKVEEKLHAMCAKQDFDILNLGVPGAGVGDYREITRLAMPLEPDVVLLNFYLGNDGPDLIHGRDTVSERAGSALTSYLVRFIRNSYILLRNAQGVPERRAALLAKRYSRGAERTEVTFRFRDDAAPFNRPTIFGDAWVRIVRDELTHFAVPAESGQLERDWAQTFLTLRRMNAALAERNIALVIALYPTEFQLDGEKLRDAIRLANTREGGRPFREDAIDSALPGKTVLEFCRAEGLTCFDITVELAEKCRAAGKPCYIPQNTHWNILGNALAADIEATALAETVCGKK